jgi:hypothetical protein
VFEQRFDSALRVNCTSTRCGRTACSRARRSDPVLASVRLLR